MDVRAVACHPVALFWSFGSAGDFDASAVTTRIEAAFHPSLVHFLPLALVLVLALLRWPPFVTVFLGALAGGLLAVGIAPERVIAFAGSGSPVVSHCSRVSGSALATGNISHTGEAAVDQLLSRGGMPSMLGTVWLILVALAFGGIIEKAGRT